MSETYSIAELRGVAVHDARNPKKRIGKVHSFVFHPRRRVLVGFTVKRPDLALMFHRPDLFVAYDSFSVADGHILVEDDPKATGKAACKRLGVEWDECILWEGMPLMTEDGRRCGHIGNVSFDSVTGEVVSLKIDQGGTRDLLLGMAEIPARYVLGFRMGVGDKLETAEGDDFLTGAIIVDEEALSVDTQGGLAAKAGAASAVAAHKVSTAVEHAKPVVQEKTEQAQKAAGDAWGKVSEAASQAAERIPVSRDILSSDKVAAQAARADATERAGEAIEEGGRLIGKQFNRTRGMFSNFKESYRKALEEDDD
jgi:uncharacterized protein YrrD